MSTAFCLNCQRVVKFASAPPDKCGNCGGTWRLVSAQDEPKKPYVLSAKDRQFLRSLRVAPEV